MCLPLIMPGVDHPWLRPASSGPSVRQPTRARPSPSLVHRHDSFAPTFSSRRRPPCRIHHLRNTSRKTTSHATVWSITHHTKGANLPWFLNLHLDECIDQHTLTNSISNKVGLNHAKTLRK